MTIFLACLVLAPFVTVSMMFWWAGCALPYGDFNPTPGGPGMRWIKYHTQLQRRVGEGSRLDWLNWRCGILLRVGTLAVFALWYMGALAEDWAVPRPLAAEISMILAPIASIFTMQAVTWLVRELWKRLEPPTLEQPQYTGDIGVSVSTPGKGHGPLALGLLLTIPFGLALFDPERASWAVVVCCLLSYPAYCWGDWLGKRFRL